MAGEPKKQSRASQNGEWGRGFAGGLQKKRTGKPWGGKNEREKSRLSFN